MDVGLPMKVKNGAQSQQIVVEMIRIALDYGGSCLASKADKIESRTSHLF